MYTSSSLKKKKKLAQIDKPTTAKVQSEHK